MSEIFIQALIDYYEATRLLNKELAICIFAFLTETYILAEDYV